MIYLTCRPAPPLAEFVEWLWFFDGFDQTHRKERVLPDGSFELVIDLRTVPRKLFDRQDPRLFKEYRRAWLSGAQSEFIVIDALPDSSMIGAHFKPGGAAAFLPMPASEMTNLVVELDAIWGSQGLRWRDALLEEPDPGVKFKILEAFLLDRWKECSTRRSATPEMSYALQRLSCRDSVASMAQVARELGISHKTFIEKFHAHVGLTPKRFCRIRRFQRLLESIQSQKAVEWAGLACERGYYDQAHLINDFQAFSGINPSEYLRCHGNSGNFVPIEG